MNENEYLQKIVTDHKMKDGDKEVTDAMAVKVEVERLIRSKLTKAVPVIEVAGSYAKGTMIRDHYDLDLVCYFQNAENEAGDTLEEIYFSMDKILSEEYQVTPKNAALLLSTKDNGGNNLHLDVVPGRFIDESGSDCFLYQNDGDKCRLQTNLHTHVAHVQESGVIDAIILTKYWRHRRGLNDDIRTFVLELAVIDILKDKVGFSIAEQMQEILTVFRDNIESVSIIDPANANNNLAAAFDESVKKKLQLAAKSSLASLESGGWEAVFPDTMKTFFLRPERLAAVVNNTPIRSKPWAI